MADGEAAHNLREMSASELAGNENSAIITADAIPLNANIIHAAGSVSVRIPQLKLPELSSTSSDSEEEHIMQFPTANIEATIDVEENLGRATSPPPNCAICLGRCKNKCFTDSCMHQFCFKCLCEWSKVKPECPLCKQTFKSIIHNVKSMSQFERYHVQPPPTAAQIPHRPIEVAYRSVPFFVDVVHGRDDYAISIANLSGPRTAHRFERGDRVRVLSAFANASANATNESIWGGSASSRSITGSAQNQLMHRTALLDMYRQEHPEANPTSGTLSQQWRRYVYDRKLYAMPVCDITGRFRESNARFYRDNPAQIHRLMPWINRDIVVLLRNTTHDVTTVLECVKESLSLANILSPAFRRRLHPFLSTRTAHFIHELNNFARSPYDMIGYDRAVQYSAQGSEEIVVGFSSSGSSDEDNVNVIDGSASQSQSQRLRSTVNSGSSEYRIQTRGTNSMSGQPPMVNLLSFTISTTSEGVEAPGVTVAVSGRSAQSTAINLTTHNRAGDVIDLDDSEMDEVGRNAYSVPTATTTRGDLINASVETDMAVGVSSSRANASVYPNAPATFRTALTSADVTHTDNIELTSSSSDECEFVLERKPPHLRTPEMVSLNSESDSDVVFVEETKPLRKTSYSSSEEVENASKRTATAHVKHEHEVYNIGASTSTGLRSSTRTRSQERSSRQMEKSAMGHGLKRKQQVHRRRSLRNSKTSQAWTLQKKHQAYNSGDSYSSTSLRSANSSDSEEEKAMYGKRRKSNKLQKNAKPQKTAISNRRVTRLTQKEALTSIDDKREKSQKREGTARKRCKRKALDRPDSTSEEEDEVLNLKMLKSRLAAEKVRFEALRREFETFGESAEMPTTSTQVQEQNQLGSSCSHSNNNSNSIDDWHARTRSSSRTNKESSYDKKRHTGDKYKVVKSEQDEESTSASKLRTTSRTSQHSNASNSSTSTTTASSAASGTSSCSSSTASTSTAMCTRTTTSAGEGSDTNDVGEGLNFCDFNMEPEVEAIPTSSKQSLQPAGPIDPTSASSTAEASAFHLCLVPQNEPICELDIENDSSATLANACDQAIAMLGLDMPIYSETEAEGVLDHNDNDDDNGNDNSNSDATDVDAEVDAETEVVGDDQHVHGIRRNEPDEEPNIAYDLL